MLMRDDGVCLLVCPHRSHANFLSWTFSLPCPRNKVSYYIEEDRVYFVFLLKWLLWTSRLNGTISLAKKIFFCKSNRLMHAYNVWTKYPPCSKKLFNCRLPSAHLKIVFCSWSLLFKKKGADSDKYTLQCAGLPVSWWHTLILWYF